ncbi:zinc-ribbon domain-containing protein [Neotabrizicola shimadae]|uniref:Zinc-ribbon domain-containing protein n=1 Tax=Neotabrizicola shimadae TaxID=2807096 RepID=A0A8G0ZT73_9RHOB|nr:zinc-ribbon domain-containing protein [Neotabrizicola shimadae]QYZ69005.1 zinc-ribbon domain-containing protein [Neotabrizicola shimadae]
MRLICPNCSAEYEVDDAAIPDTGRDVQCSNCGHGWFQLPPHVEAEAEAEAEVFDEPEPVAVPAIASPLPGEDDDDEPEPPPPDQSASPRQPRTLDDSVLAVLKEEAEREANARRAEAMRTIETQPDLGLDSAVAGAVAASAAAEREARARAKPVEVIPSAEDIAREAAAEAGVAPSRASRRGQLPDIEEINSTLRATDDRAGLASGLAPDDMSPRRGGFGRGFMLMILLALILAVTYLMAPRFAAQVPALKPALDGYVGAVDSARLYLDGLLKSATGAVESVSPAPGG